MYKAAVITISDKGAVGQRVDTSGPNLVNILKEHEYDVVYTTIIPDDFETIKEAFAPFCTQVNEITTAEAFE